VISINTERKAENLNTCLEPSSVLDLQELTCGIGACILTGKTNDTFQLTGPSILSKADQRNKLMVVGLSSMLFHNKFVESPLLLTPFERKVLESERKVQMETHSVRNSSEQSLGLISFSVIDLLQETSKNPLMENPFEISGSNLLSYLRQTMRSYSTSLVAEDLGVKGGFSEFKREKSRAVSESASSWSEVVKSGLLGNLTLDRLQVAPVRPGGNSTRSGVSWADITEEDDEERQRLN